jgi:hypothetical protein
MDKRYQIFVSSTHSDLHKERERVINELTRIGYIAVGMEQFPATDEEQLEYIRPIIDESDYYVVILRGKYGSLANDGISFTEKECDYALETKKPVLAFLFKNPGQLRVDGTDADPEKARKLDVFKKKLEERRIVKYWEDSSQLIDRQRSSVHFPFERAKAFRRAVKSPSLPGSSGGLTAPSATSLLVSITVV